MRRFTGLIPAVAIMTISLVSMTLVRANGTEVDGKHTHSVTQQKTATQNVPARVKVPKFKVLRTNPYRKLSIAEGIDTEVDDENIAPGYRRRDLTRIEPSDELSDYVTIRLAIARAKAMEAYRNKWQT